MAQTSSSTAKRQADATRYGSAIAGNLAAATLRSLGQFYDLQAATARIMLRSHMRALSAMGLPDYSRLFQVADDRALTLFSAGTDNALRFADQADDTLGQIHGHFSRLLEQQAIGFTERWQSGLEELQQQAGESLQELQELARQQADEMARATDSLTDMTQATLREGGEQFRATVRQGLEHSRELASRQVEALRRGGERLNESARGAVREGAEIASQAGERAAKAGKAA
jgi:DNA anti-recombination protein RmuC